MYCHDLQVAHRDIKPSNLFLDSDGCIKLGDFGVSRILFEAIEPFTEADTRAGTKRYMAPEVINRRVQQQQQQQQQQQRSLAPAAMQP